MDNCGISFGNDLKYVAFGDTSTIHYSLFTFHFFLPRKAFPFGEGGFKNVLLGHF